MWPKEKATGITYLERMKQKYPRPPEKKEVPTS
jgi:hypothetical protein